MTDKFLIERSGICIDAAHRVPLHGSKCRSLHGHRYEVFAACVGTLAKGTSEDGMVMDFAFLKDELMAVIDAGCDHGLILSQKDSLIHLLLPAAEARKVSITAMGLSDFLLMDGVGVPCENVPVVSIGKLYVIANAPTAENLARHWYLRLKPRIEKRSGGRAVLSSIKVFETPNCSATYPVG